MGTTRRSLSGCISIYPLTHTDKEIRMSQKQKQSDTILRRQYCVKHLRFDKEFLCLYCVDALRTESHLKTTHLTHRHPIQPLAAERRRFIAQ